MGCSVARISPSKSKTMARITDAKIRIAGAVTQDRTQRKTGSIGWASATLSGLALVTVALMLVVLFGVLDALRYSSIADFFPPDPTPAAGTLGLVGGAERSPLSLVLPVPEF